MSLENMSVEELSRKMEGNRKIIIQEVTESTQRQWLFRGERLKQVSEKKLNEKDLEGVDEVIFVCEDKDLCTPFVQDMDGNTHVRYLGGGYRAWGQFYHPVLIGYDEGLKVWQIQRLATGTLSYMIVDGKQSIIVNPSYHIDYYLGLAHNQQTDIACVIDTQIHNDHVTGGPRLAAKTSSPYYVPDHEALQEENESLHEHSKITVGNGTIKVITFSPQNEESPPSYCLLLNDRFLWIGGTSLQMIQAQHRDQHSELGTLSGDVQVLPDHVHTLGRINEHGIFATTLDSLQEDVDPSNQEKVMLHDQPQPTIEQEIIHINLNQEDITLEKANQLELKLSQ